MQYDNGVEIIQDWQSINSNESNKLNIFKSIAQSLYSMSYETYTHITNFNDVHYNWIQWEAFSRDRIVEFLNYDEELQQRFVDFINNK